MNRTTEWLSLQNSSSFGDDRGPYSSYHLLSCAARAQAVASLLDEPDPLSEPDLPETDQALELLVRQLRRSQIFRPPDVDHYQR